MRSPLLALGILVLLWTPGAQSLPEIDPSRLHPPERTDEGVCLDTSDPSRPQVYLGANCGPVFLIYDRGIVHVGVNGCTPVRCVYFSIMFRPFDDGGGGESPTTLA